MSINANCYVAFAGAIYCASFLGLAATKRGDMLVIEQVGNPFIYRPDIGIRMCHHSNWQSLLSADWPPIPVPKRINKPCCVIVLAVILGLVGIWLDRCWSPSC